MGTDKYSNLDTALPGLSTVLRDAIQSGTLEIKGLDKMCSKFLKALQSHPELAEAEFVVYSPFVRKNDHPFEHFAFLDKRGHSICHISGVEMELYGVMESCSGLKLSDAFLREYSLSDS